jgi:hypothetical protein
MKKTIFISLILCCNFSNIKAQTKEETILWLIDTYENECGANHYVQRIDENTGYLTNTLEVEAGTYFAGINLKNVYSIKYEKIKVVGGSKSYASAIALYGSNEQYFILRDKPYTPKIDDNLKISLNILFCESFDKKGYINRYIKALSHLVYLYSKRKPNVVYQNKNKKSPF